MIDAGGASSSLEGLLRAAARRGGGLVVLTGAGISAASGIPTFRGRDGYWTVGSRHYAPQEMATAAMFARHPDAVWGWYLYRRGVCSAAEPNDAHRAIVVLENAFGHRFTLLTQNVDGLHLRAGSSLDRTLHVHGNLHFMRCAGACPAPPTPVPEGFVARPAGEPLAATERAAFRCRRCGGWMRPHVLWFDETYDEANYRFESALAAAASAAILVVVGTSGATTLPMRAAALAAHGGALLINVDPEDNPFAALARATGGVHLTGSAVEHVPQVVRHCIAGLGGAGG